MSEEKGEKIIKAFRGNDEHAGRRVFAKGDSMQRFYIRCTSRFTMKGFTRDKNIRLDRRKE
jgi:hypothetical protein